MASAPKLWVSSSSPKARYAVRAKDLPRGEQIFRGLQHAEDLLFDVKRAAAPDIAVRDVAGKGGMRPVLLCALNNGNDVLMRHVEAGGAEKHRCRGW